MTLVSQLLLYLLLLHGAYAQTGEVWASLFQYEKLLTLL